MVAVAAGAIAGPCGPVGEGAVSRGRVRGSRAVASEVRAADACDFRVRAVSENAARPTTGARRPWLIVNPRSGGGKASRFRIAERACAFGAQVFLIDPSLPQDVATVARRAVDDGADLLGVVEAETVHRRLSPRWPRRAACPSWSFRRVPATTSPWISAWTVRTLRPRWRPSGTASSCAWVWDTRASGRSSTTSRSVLVPPLCRTRLIGTTSLARQCASFRNCLLGTRARAGGLHRAAHR